MASIVGVRSIRLLVIAGFALALAACSKCDVPVWQPNHAPQSCHDDAAVK
jgi:hypothetical protein